MCPCEIPSTAGSNSSSSSTLNSFLTNLRVEMNRMSRKSADEAERRAGIARVSDLRESRLNTTVRSTVRSGPRVNSAYSGICNAE